MKKLLLLTLILLLVTMIACSQMAQAIKLSYREKATKYKAGDYKEKIDAGGRKRTYLLHIPSGFSSEKQYPLVLGFHGGAGSGKKFAKQTGFSAKADQEGFIAVYPDGIKHNWNDGRGTTDAEKLGVDDIKFVRALVTSLTGKLPIDTKRIYATGVSNGGIFSHRLGCEMVDTFAAIGPVIGSIATSLAPKCNPTSPISVVVIQGTKDPFIPIEGGDTKHKTARIGDGGLVEPAEKTMQLWAEKNSCTRPFTVTELPQKVNDGTSVRKITYTGCSSNSEVQYYIVEGMGHGWPPKGGETARVAVSGTISQNIDATQVIWEFFESHPKFSANFISQEILVETIKIESPFGINDAVASTRDKSSDYLQDLGVQWISDHIPRRAIEKSEKIGDYNFQVIDERIREYIEETSSNAWFVINVESKFAFRDGIKIKWGKSEGKYIPYGTESKKAYEVFLRNLIPYINSRVSNLKVRYWSIDNEHTTLFIPAFCSTEKEAKNNKECVKKAAQAYADLVEFSYLVIKSIDPEAKIVFGGPASVTSDEDYEFYYKEALKILKSKHPSGYFDFFDYHDFAAFFKDYKTNLQGKDVEFFRRLLLDAGFQDKPIIIKAGATHSGKDTISKSKRLHNLQTEAEQAEYLVKRAVDRVAKGVQVVLWGNILEHTDVDMGDHGTFSYGGLVYNGRPTPCNSQEITPCPDPGDGVKKLSYYTNKFLIEKLRGSDFANINTINTGIPNVYLYEFTKEGKPIYVAWWDYFEEKGIIEKQVTLSLPNLKTSQVKITEAIPDFDGPFQSSTKKLNEADYPKFFKTYIIPVTDNIVSLTLSKKPVYIKAFS